MQLLATLMIALAASAAGGQRSPAELLTTIADPSWGERARVQRRFEYLLPRYMSACADIGTEMKAADMAALTFRKIDEAGLNEDLLELTEGIYGVILHARALGLLGDGGCAEYFATYMVLRQEGMSPADATDGIKGLLSALR